MHQVDLFRKRVLRDVSNWRIYISSLPTREQVALERLSGATGIQTAARICEYVLQELGHQVTVSHGKDFRFSPSVRAARKVFGRIEPEALATMASAPSALPAAVHLETEEGGH